jgi:hypothetical protein
MVHVLVERIQKVFHYNQVKNLIQEDEFFDQIIWLKIQKEEFIF